MRRPRRARPANDRPDSDPIVGAQMRARVAINDRRAKPWHLSTQSRAAIGTELRFALISLRRAPIFGAAVVLVLALGIGVNAAMFGVTDRLLLSPPAHVQDADEIVRVFYEYTPQGSTERMTSDLLPYADYGALREGVGQFREVAAYSRDLVPSVLDRGAEATELQLSHVTANFFRMLGVQAVVGRFFSDWEDALPRGERVAVLSHAFWRRRYGGDTAVIGRLVDIDHASYEVIGVAPPGFTGVDLGPVDAWALATAVGADMAGDDWHVTRNMHWLRVLARIWPSTRVDAAQQEATAAFLNANQDRFVSDQNARIVLGSIIAARAPAVGVATAKHRSRIALWLLGVSGIVLIIGCANVANLLFTRGLRRRRELGVRAALGASRGRVALQVSLEALVLALCGLALGLALAHWGGELARTLLMPGVEWPGSPIDRRVLVVATAMTGVSALLAALMPVVHAMRVDAGDLLRSSGRMTQRRSRLRSGLVVLQAALSIVLLVGAGLFVRSLRHAASIPLGFDADRVAIFQWHSNGLDWDRARTHALYDAAIERLRLLPEVESAALSMTEPMRLARTADVRAPDVDTAPAPDGGGMYFTPVSLDYFRTMGSRILRGRTFTRDDLPGSLPVAIVTASMGRLVWPGVDPLGRCLVVLDLRDDICREVVGVVEDTRYMAIEEEPTPMFFLPMTQVPGWGRMLFVRLKVDPAYGIATVRNALLQIEPGLPYIRSHLLRSNVQSQLEPWRLGSTLFTAFGLLALTMAGFGLYAVVAYDSAQRKREFGIRMALGAPSTALLALVLRDAGRVIAIGLLAGLAVAGWAARWIEPLLYGVSARDPIVLVVVVTILLGVGLLAAAAPAWRAAQVQATEVLREE